jgi:4-hydroxy-tetrahydrodipicolinate synthase
MKDGGTRLDLPATGRLVGWLVERGIHGLFIAGTTGEGLYLSAEEHRDLTQAVTKAARGVPVVAHVGALTTAEAVALSRQAAQAEVTAVAAIPPSYYSMTREEILGYFTAIGKAAEPLPLYLYNIPSHARNDLPPALVKEIRKAVPNVAGIKDSSGLAGRIADLVRTMGPEFAVVCGNDEKELGAFQEGAAGVVSYGHKAVPA